MNGEENKRKNSAAKLVKVNAARGEKKRYDAYGYEIEEERAPHGENGETFSPREAGGDLRAAIENAARRYSGAERDVPAGREGRAGQTARGGQSRQNAGSAQTGGSRKNAPSRGAGSHSARLVEEKKAQAAAESAKKTSVERPAEKKPERRDSRKARAARAKAAKAEKAAAAARVREEKEKEIERETARQIEAEKKMTPAEKRIRYRKQERARRWSGAIKVLAVIAVVALIIVIITVNSGRGKGVNTQFLSRGTIEDSVSGTLSFIRGEIPVSSQFSGVFMPNVNEGDRVSVNAVVGYVVKPEYSDALRELKETENKITAAKHAAAYLDATKSSEMLALEDAIENGIDRLAALSMAGRLSGYSDCFTELSALFDRRNELEMNAETADSYISGLQTQRYRILNEISSYMMEVRAPAAGVVSFRTDGYEENVTACSKALEARIAETNFASARSSTLTAEELRTFTVPHAEMTFTPGSAVSNGSTVARVAPESSFYMMMKLDGTKEHRIAGGEAIQVYVQEQNARFSAAVVGVYTEGSDLYIVLRSDRSLDSTVSLRQAKATLIFSDVEGLKVPLRVLSDWDKAGITARLTVLRSGYVRYAYVNILARDDSYAIINNRSTLDDGTGIYVRENEEYIVNFDKIEEGQGV